MSGASPDAEPRFEHRSRDGLMLAVFVGGCLLAAALGGAITASTVDGWYQGLQKPAFNPPDSVFGPVWTVLFVLMGVAAWRVWRQPSGGSRAGALACFAVQLVLNVLWSLLFFGLQAVGAALIEIGVLWAAIAATVVAFARVDRVAAWLLVPYLGWVTFAVVLNASIWRLN